MSYSQSGSIAINVPTQVVQELLVRAYSPDNNPAVQAFDVRPFGVSAVSAQKNQVLRFDFELQAQGAGTLLTSTTTFVEGQDGTSWWMLKPFIKRKVKKELEEMKRQAEAQAA
jgi:hypothetical protein